MSEFHTVTQEFEKLIKNYDFKLPKKLWYDNLVALTKHIEGIFYCYVIARVFKQDGSLQTSMWVGPINRPDDGLENLSANIKVEIGYTQELDEDFFKNCEKKIISLINSDNLITLLNASKQELKNPSRKNYRYEVYVNNFLPFFKQVIKANNENNKILGQKKECEIIIEKVFTELEGEMKMYFDKLGLKATKDKIWELCYIYSLDY